jgi:hypothetical protein
LCSVLYCTNIVDGEAIPFATGGRTINEWGAVLFTFTNAQRWHTLLNDARACVTAVPKRR